MESDRAIVTATPGTTRDLVTETVALGGIPVKLVDTAGIRHALDEAEGIGIRKSMEALADADLVLVVLDSSEPAAPKINGCWNWWRSGRQFWWRTNQIKPVRSSRFPVLSCGECGCRL